MMFDAKTANILNTFIKNINFFRKQMLCVHTGRFCVELHVFEQDSICVAIVLETKGLLQKVLCRDVPHYAIHTKKKL